ncbi:MAG: MBL fold metallo-hydrolase [Sandaracinaceae bacterium]
MVLRQLFDAESSTYTYLLADGASREAVVVDPVFEQHLRDAALLRELGLRPVAVLDTHVHADHVTGAWLLRQAFGCSIGVAEAAGANGADLLLKHGDRVSFGGRHLEVRATPGHTSGCLTYVLDDQSMAFTGDCLMIRGAGRTDFQQGDARQMFRSIREQIFSLPDACLLYPAHDYGGRTVSTVAEEREHNPRVGGEADEGDFVGYMHALNLPHPKRIDVAVPANLEVGRPADGHVPAPATWGPVVQTYAGILEIGPEWVAEHRDEVRVLDVRRPEEWTGELGAIEGSLQVPLDELTSRLDDVPRDHPIVAVCRSGKRSGQAVVLLRKHGFRDVANLTGGMLRWRDLGLPCTDQQIAG